MNRVYSLELSKGLGYFFYFNSAQLNSAEASGSCVRKATLMGKMEDFLIVWSNRKVSISNKDDEVG